MPESDQNAPKSDGSSEDFTDFENFWEFLNVDDEGAIFGTLLTEGGSHSGGGGDQDRTYSIEHGFLKWSIGMRPLCSEGVNIDEAIMKTLQLYYEHMGSEYGVEDWMQLICVIPFNPSKKYYELFCKLARKSEEKLFGSKTGTALKPSYKAVQSIQVIFNMRRVYLRAEEGDFEAAETILRAIEDMDIPPATRVDVLFLHFITSICTGDWDSTIHSIQKMWSIVKLMDAKQRYDANIWDDWFMANIILWFFGRHSQELRKLLATKLFTRPESLFSPKKRALFAALKSTDIARFVSPIYYTRACAEIPGLPPLTVDDIATENLDDE